LPAPSSASPVGTYYWKSKTVDQTAELVTLFCRSCESSTPGVDVPLIAVLHDTLGDSASDNDRVTYVWLLTYSSPTLWQRLVSGIPFFYWRASDGRPSDGKAPKPFFNVSAPEHPVFIEAGRDIVQWAALDGMMTPIRASSREYRSNQIDHERFHLEEAITYLREAPVSVNGSGLSEAEINTVIARLTLRKQLLGGFVSQRRAAHLGEEAAFRMEETRSRNWEILRMCAEKTGLYFEPLNLAGNTDQFAILWFPLNDSLNPANSSQSVVWKLLNISDPWTEARLSKWSGIRSERYLDANGSLSARSDSTRRVEMVPLAIYSLNYPKQPLLLIDFRDTLRVRRHEMTQRSINELTAGVIGISHFTNWYYYVGADLYDFIAGRHGAALDRAARLDAYAQFRAELTLDRQMDRDLLQAISDRAESLSINPMDRDPQREVATAQAQYLALLRQTDENGKITKLLAASRRSELNGFGASLYAKVRRSVFRDISFGLYGRRDQHAEPDLAQLNRERRVEADLSFLHSVVAARTEPEIAYGTGELRQTVTELADLVPLVPSPALRQDAMAKLENLSALSEDTVLRAECTAALESIRRDQEVQRQHVAAGVVAFPHAGRPKISLKEAGPVN
jgi:hypothetical protein